MQVVNLPEVQKVDGDVKVTSPTPHSSLVEWSQRIVSPGTRAAPGDYVLVGSLDAAGFTNVVLSVHGRLGDRTFRAGEVGVVLLPDQEGIVEAFEDEAQWLFAVESIAAVSSQPSVHFSSPQTWSVLGFPRYRVYAYNTSDRSVELDIYAYLGQ